MFIFFFADRETEALTLHHSALGYSYQVDGCHRQAPFMIPCALPPHTWLVWPPTPLKTSPMLYLLRPAEGCCSLISQWLLEQRRQKPLF